LAEVIFFDVNMKRFSVLYQTGVLVAVMFVGFLIGQIIAVIIFAATSANPFGNMVFNPLEQPVRTIQTAQFFTAVFTFLLPACITAWICSDRPKAYLSIQAFPDISLSAVICLTTLLLTPTVSLTGYFNSHMHLPESMAAIEEWIKSTEEVAEALVRKMISDKGVVTFIINLFVIAVVAAVTEEFLFRGALLHIVRQKIKNHHAAIWIVAILFSAIHLQFYGFIPRMILGAYLGYLVYWTKNIWVPIFAHFSHNAFAFIGMSSNSLKDNAIFADEIAPEDIRWLSITASLCLIAFIYCIRYVRRIAVFSENGELKIDN
jgi:membrane protease YdiL (CAAX protease family)